MKAIRHSREHHGITRVVGSNMVEVEDGPVTTMLLWGHIEGVVSFFVNENGDLLPVCVEN